MMTAYRRWACGLLTAAALLLAVAAGLSYIKYKIKTLLKNAAEKKG